MNFSCEGAVVGGGCRGFHAVTGYPGVLFLIYWEYGCPAAYRTVELKSHWMVNMEKLVGEAYEDTGILGLYGTSRSYDEEENDEVLRKTGVSPVHQSAAGAFLRLRKRMSRS